MTLGISMPGFTEWILIIIVFAVIYFFIRLIIRLINRKSK